MIDLHYDLLTDIYLKIRNNKENEIKLFCDEVYNDNNITGGILNLYFMSKKEMLDELGIKESEINVIEMFRLVTNYIHDNKLLDTNNFMFSIEGCDYLDIEDLEVLKKLGLRAILPVWNNQSKYGSGINSEIGLTDLGNRLINKAIDLNIGIDLSHANENTFWDIICIIKNRINNGDAPIVYASHSNSINLCSRKRNLNDKQILAIKEVNGIIGLVAIKIFVKDNYEEIKNIENYFIKHINYVANLLNGYDNIAISTDDMNFSTNQSSHGLNVFNIRTIKKDLKKELLKNGYSNADINKIMFRNGNRLIMSLNRKRYI